MIGRDKLINEKKNEEDFLKRQRKRTVTQKPSNAPQKNPVNTNNTKNKLKYCLERIDDGGLIILKLVKGKEAIKGNKTIKHGRSNNSRSKSKKAKKKINKDKVFNKPKVKITGEVNVALNPIIKKENLLDYDKFLESMLELENDNSIPVKSVVTGSDPSSVTLNILNQPPTNVVSITKKKITRTIKKTNTTKIQKEKPKSEQGSNIIKIPSTNLIIKEENIDLPVKVIPNPLPSVALETEPLKLKRTIKVINNL
jgi:hypothetical protein